MVIRACAGTLVDGASYLLEIDPFCSWLFVAKAHAGEEGHFAPSGVPPPEQNTLLKSRRLAAYLSIDLNNAYRCTGIALVTFIAPVSLIPLTGIALSPFSPFAPLSPFSPGAPCAPEDPELPPVLARHSLNAFESLVDLRDFGAPDRLLGPGSFPHAASDRTIMKKAILGTLLIALATSTSAFAQSGAATGAASGAVAR